MVRTGVQAGLGLMAMILLSSCESLPAGSGMLRSWTGASQNELERAWGQPMGKVFTKKGDQVLLFEVPRRDVQVDAAPPGFAQPRLSPTVCRALFTVNPLGTVTGSKSVGDGCADQ